MQDKQDKPVTSINITDNVALITIDNLPSEMNIVPDILSTIAAKGINVDMITQIPPLKGTMSLSFSIPADDLVKALEALQVYRKNTKDVKIEIDAENTKFQIYGEGMRNMPGVAARLFKALSKEAVEIKLVTTSEVDISLLVYPKDVDRALAAIEEEFGIKANQGL